MKEKIKNRLKELREEYKRVTNKNWIQQTNVPTQKQSIEKCKALIEELEALLK